MEYRRFSDTIVARLDRGEELIEAVSTLCRRERISLGSINAIGAVSEAELGCFDTAEKKYYAKRYAGAYEIASLSGTVSEKDASPYLHIHAVLAGRDGAAIGGHLSRAVISATCELTLCVISGSAGRAFSQEIGLNLIMFDV